MTLPKWYNLFKKTTTLNLRGRLRNKFCVLDLVLNLRFHTHVYLWTNLNLNFFKRKSISLEFGFAILMMSSLFGLMVKKSSAHFWKI